MKIPVCIASIIVALVAQGAAASTIIIEARESIIKRSPLIVDAYVTDVAFTP
jgi:hypothetical protein